MREDKEGREELTPKLERVGNGKGYREEKKGELAKCWKGEVRDRKEKKKRGVT